MNLQFFEINVLEVSIYKDLKKNLVLLTFWSFFNFFSIAVRNIVLNLFLELHFSLFGGIHMFS